LASIQFPAIATAQDFKQMVQKQKKVDMEIMDMTEKQVLRYAHVTYCLSYLRMVM
jgi:hypothetical protein